MPRSKLYEVEKIIDHREGNSGTEFLVRWANYTSGADTWEPIDNLKNCDDIIVNYMETMDKKSNKGKTRRSTRLSQAFKLDESQVKEEPQVTRPKRKREPTVTKTTKSSTTKTKSTKSRGKTMDITSTIDEDTSTRKYSTRSTRSTSRQVDISDDEADILAASKPLLGRKQLSESKFRKEIGGLFSSTPFASEKEPLKKSLGFDSYNLRRKATVTTTVTHVVDKTDSGDAMMGEDMIGEADSDDDEITRAAQKKQDLATPAEASSIPPPTENSAQWMEIGWKEVALATVITGIGVLGYVCYVTDYCSYC